MFVSQEVVLSKELTLRSASDDVYEVRRGDELVGYFVPIRPGTLTVCAVRP